MPDSNGHEITRGAIPPFIELTHRRTSNTLRMLSDNNGSDLHAELKKVASEKMGTDLASAMRPDDAARYRAGSNAMADAIREAREKLERRKKEIGDEAALAELDASIRGGELKDR